MEPTQENPYAIQEGDAVYHVSNKEIIMGVEWVEDGQAGCSWIDLKSGHNRQGDFSLKVLRKVDDKNTGASGIFLH